MNGPCRPPAEVAAEVLDGLTSGEKQMMLALIWAQHPEVFENAMKDISASRAVRARAEAGKINPGIYRAVTAKD